MNTNRSRDLIAAATVHGGLLAFTVVVIALLRTEWVQRNLPAYAEHLGNLVGRLLP